MRAGVPVMSLRLLLVTLVHTNSVATERPLAAGRCRRRRGRSQAHAEWMSPVRNTALLDAVVAQVAEHLAPVGGVAVPLVDVVRDARRAGSSPVDVLHRRQRPRRAAAGSRTGEIITGLPTTFHSARSSRPATS